MSRIRIKLKAYDAAQIDRSAKMIVETVKNKGGRVSGPIPLPTRIRKYTVLRSPHVDKDSREQFEIRVHKRVVDILDPSQELVVALSEIQLPPGVEIGLKQ